MSARYRLISAISGSAASAAASGSPSASVSSAKALRSGHQRDALRRARRGTEIRDVRDGLGNRIGQVPSARDQQTRGGTVRLEQGLGIGARRSDARRLQRFLQRLQHHGPTDLMQQPAQEAHLDVVPQAARNLAAHSAVASDRSRSGRPAAHTRAP